ncbi:hypothetical protein NB636_05820 [Oxalobacter aliiformigenes]|uniref:hypothetical protein n=1 Tax=Oxalobacter aliiformigenes TaxID=2946593 RepID=UPI0022AE613D|nr:hypothetical protein [Oxalobacter aliiformigenes]MCZ4065184.1 hypothetical protein [Oxalobacter aliiformigenes]WAV98269.1 hypothetical protein NB636_05820 [Oxalobacter aliiformigenes]
MRYDKPGYGDPCTWGPVTRHPNDPRTDFSDYETRLEKLAFAFGQRIRSRMAEDDETAIRVADQLIRYLTDIEVVGIIRDTARGKKESVFLAIRELIEEAIGGVAENLAAEQLEHER